MILPLTREIFCKNIQTLLMSYTTLIPTWRNTKVHAQQWPFHPSTGSPIPVSFASDLTQHHGRLQANLRNILYLYKLEHTSTQQSVVKLS
jgi:hypothetical protein